ncbi:MAG: hypothetical protein ACK4NS_08385 [Saprospiraceae bacterium]
MKNVAHSVTDAVVRLDNARFALLSCSFYLFAFLLNCDVAARTPAPLVASTPVISATHRSANAGWEFYFLVAELTQSSESNSKEQYTGAEDAPIGGAACSTFHPNISAVDRYHCHDCDQVKRQEHSLNQRKRIPLYLLFSEFKSHLV